MLPRKRISRLIGSIADLDGPQAVVDKAVDAFVRTYGIDLSEAVVPQGGFRSFNDFFTRRLVAGARPVAPDARILVSPADGKVEDLGPIDRASTLLVKGKLYEVGDLLGSDEEAARFEGGSYFIVYLSPRDYHRVHAPVTGPVETLRYVPGTLFPVNRIGTEHIPRLFARNERMAIRQRSQVHGEVVSVMVGAIGVGRIGLAFDDAQTNRGERPGLRTYGDEPPVLERGEELGVFHLGSTVIVFATSDAALEFLVEPGVSVRVGEGIARAAEGSSR